MIIPKEIIEKAISGGWQFGRMQSDGLHVELRDPDWTMADVVLSSEFWQALGKSLGWEKDGKGTYFTNWTASEYMAHRFFDLILQGKPTADYWQELLTNQ